MPQSHRKDLLCLPLNFGSLLSDHSEAHDIRILVYDILEGVKKDLG